MTLITRTLRALAVLSSVSLCAFNLSASVAISTASPLPAGTVSAPYSAQLRATGGTAPYTWAVSSCSGSCNTGLSSPGFATSGNLSGTPANTGTSTFGITVKDASGNTTTKSLSITVVSQAASSSSTPAISTASLPAATISKPYSASISVSGGTAPYTYAVSSCSGACNTGLSSPSFGTTGVLSGTPANTGTSTFGFTVKDVKGQTATKTLSLTVTAATSTAPVAVTVSPSTAAINTGVTQQFRAGVTGSTNTAVTWSVNGVQGGNSTTGTISASGLYTAPAAAPTGGSVTVTATSTADTTKSASATVSVSKSASTVAVTINPTSASLTTAGNQQFSASVTGSTSTGVTWQVNNTTGGSPSTGTISTTGLYTAPNTVPAGGSVTVTARSSYDSTKSASSTVSITAATTIPTGTFSGWNFGTPTYYASPNGSGTTCSASAPCTIDYAVNTKAVAGNVVQAAAGTYAYGGTALSLSKSGTAGHPIVLTCVTRRACYITGTRTGNTDVVGVSGNYITMDGFDISNVSPTIPSSNMLIFVSGTHNIFSRNAIHDVQVNCADDNGGGGVQVAASAGYNTFDANLIYNIGNNNPRCKVGTTVQFDGILAETTGTGGTTITNNIVYNVHGGWGIALGGGAGGGVASNNLVFSNGNGGIVVHPGTAAAVVSNNIIADNGAEYNGCGIYYLASTSSVISTLNNSIYGNTGGNFCQYSMTGATANSGDINSASFVNFQASGSGDYHEASGSPTIDAGSSKNATDHDYAGDPRPQGNAIDIGPYEHN